MGGAPWTGALVGRTLCGRYRVEGLVGAGGMGAVLRATHTGTGREVAVKVMLPELARDTELVRRFHREARTAASVAGRGVAQVLDLDTDPSVGPVLVLELLAGETLHARVVRAGALAPPDAVRICVAVLATLRVVHDKGIVHRDLKPANVFLAHDEEGDHVKLLDFGIARVETAMRTTALTLPGTALGTPRYMAPEQALGAPDVDPRADLYAVGAILRFALAGEPPYAEVPSDQVLAAVLAGPPVPLSVRRPDVPPPLADVVERAMCRDKSERFVSASEMRDALLAAAGASAASRTGASTTSPTTAARLPPTLSARAAPAGALPTVAAPPPRAQGAPVRRPRRASGLRLLVLLGGGGMVLLGLLAVLVTGAATAIISKLNSLEASRADLTERLTADLATARALRAAGRRREGGEKLMNVVHTAQVAGVGRNHPAAPVTAAARLALAAAFVDHLGAGAADLGCTSRLRGARVALGLAREHVAAADGLVGTSGDLCGLAEVAEAEVAASRVPVPSADPAPGDCATAARTLLDDARLLGTRAVAYSDARCAGALEQAQSRATDDLSALDFGVRGPPP